MSDLECSSFALLTRKNGTLFCYIIKCVLHSIGFKEFETKVLVPPDMSADEGGVDVEAYKPRLGGKSM